MTEFTLYEALIGGALISVSALILLLFNGKIAGISGIFFTGFYAFLSKNNTQVEKWWRLVFLAGLIMSPLLAGQFDANLPERIDISWPVLMIAGFLVGVGTRLGSGCTSGHGICGIGRLSARSIIATCIFMLTAVLTVFLFKLI